MPCFEDFRKKVGSEKKKRSKGTKKITTGESDRNPICIS